MKRKSIAVLLSLSMLVQTMMSVNAQGTISVNAVSGNEVKKSLVSTNEALTEKVTIGGGSVVDSGIQGNVMSQNTIFEEENFEEKQYIVVADNKACYNDLECQIGENVVAQTSELEENNMLIVKLDGSEVNELEQNDEIIIEEDIIISANSKKKQQNEGKKPVNEKNDKKVKSKDKFQSVDKTKKQIEKKKEEIFEKVNERNEAAKEAESEWNIRAVNADEAVAEISTLNTEGAEKVKVAVLDSGIDSVEGIELAGYVNLVEEEQEIPLIFQDLTGHGTGIASIIAGNGEGGIKGVNPNAELYSVRVLDKNNAAPLSRIIQGIYWCIENDIDIINMSFGTSVRSEAMKKAVEEAYDAGILMIGAAGNTEGAVEYPAAFDEVMAVAATSPEAKISNFSNTGEELDIAAPGESIKVASFFNGSTVTHGTSIAVPHVTGVAALLWEKDLTKTNEFIRQLIRQSAKEMADTQECGLLDAEYALEKYDEFAQNYNETEVTVETKIPKNTEELEVFNDISDNEAYVEGRWSGTLHKEAVEAGATGFTKEQIKIIKAGAVYPDWDSSGWKGAGNNPRWHGKWKAVGGALVNYAAVYEMVTKIALEGGKVSSFTNVGDIMGMDQSTFNMIKSDIKTFVNSKAKTVLNNLGVANTAENRKYFLWGCALHSITDAFAHSTTRSNGMIIGHQFSDTYPDDSTYYPRRYKVAVKLTEYSLECLQDEIFGDGAEIVAALNDVYKGKASYKIIKVKKFVNDNGWNDAVLSEANINEPIYP